MALYRLLEWLAWPNKIQAWKDYNMRSGGKRLMTKGKRYQDGMHMTKFVKDITKWCVIMIRIGYAGNE